VATFGLLVAICTSPLMPKGGGFGWIFLGYLATGVVLSRMIHRRLISWHPVHATISNQFSAKMSALFFWPTVYPILLFRLSIIKVL